MNKVYHCYCCCSWDRIQRAHYKAVPEQNHAIATGPHCFYSPVFVGCVCWTQFHPPVADPQIIRCKIIITGRYLRVSKRPGTYPKTVQTLRMCEMQVWGKRVASCKQTKLLFQTRLLAGVHTIINVQCKLFCQVTNCVVISDRLINTWLPIITQRTGNHESTSKVWINVIKKSQTLAGIKRIAVSVKI